MVRLKLWQVFSIAFLAGIACAIVPSIIDDFYPHPSHSLSIFLHFLERFGDALLIAVVLGGFVERIIHKQEFREYALDFFVSYFGRLLPIRLQEGIKQYLEISLIRTKWEIVYQIEEWPEKPGYIKLVTEIEYDMQNRSEAPAAFDFIYEVEDSLCPEIAETSITYVQFLEKVYETEDQLKELIKSENGYKFIRKSIPKLEPYNAIRRPTYTFKAKSIESFKNHFVSPFWASSPAISTKFTIWYDKSKFFVFFDLTFADNPQSEDLVDGAKTGTRWTIDRPILPGQGFVIRCGLKP